MVDLNDLEKRAMERRQREQERYNAKYRRKHGDPEIGKPKWGEYKRCRGLLNMGDLTFGERRQVKRHMKELKRDTYVKDQLKSEAWEDRQERERNLHTPDH